MWKHIADASVSLWHWLLHCLMIPCSLKLVSHIDWMKTMTTVVKRVFVIWWATVWPQLVLFCLYEWDLIKEYKNLKIIRMALKCHLLGTIQPLSAWTHSSFSYWHWDLHMTGSVNSQSSMWGRDHDTLLFSVELTIGRFYVGEVIVFSCIPINDPTIFC